MIKLKNLYHNQVLNNHSRSNKNQNLQNLQSLQNHLKRIRAHLHLHPNIIKKNQANNLFLVPVQFENQVKDLSKVKVNKNLKASKLLQANKRHQISNTNHQVTCLNKMNDMKKANKNHSPLLKNNHESPQENKINHQSNLKKKNNIKKNLMKNENQLTTLHQNIEEVLKKI